MRLGGYVKFGLFIVLVLFLSIVVHEFVHVVQVSLDDRVKFTHFSVLDKHLVSANVEWEGNLTNYDMTDWNINEPIREFEAYFVQFLFSVLAVRFVARR